VFFRLRLLFFALTVFLYHRGLRQRESFSVVTKVGLCLVAYDNCLADQGTGFYLTNTALSSPFYLPFFGMAVGCPWVRFGSAPKPTRSPLEADPKPTQLPGGQGAVLVGCWFDAILFVEKGSISALDRHKRRAHQGLA